MCQFCCTTRARRGRGHCHVSLSCWPNAARASPCGRTPLIICPNSRSVDRRSTPCACRTVSGLITRLCLTITQLISNHSYRSRADHAKMIGFSYDSNQAAQDTWHHVERLMADPVNIALNAAGRKRATKQPKRPKAAPLPPKSQISAPCQFHHVTSVAAGDMSRYFSLQAFVNATAKHRSHWANTNCTSKLRPRFLQNSAIIDFLCAHIILLSMYFFKIFTLY